MSERAEAALRRLIAAAEHCQVNNSVVAWSELGDALADARALSGARPPYPCDCGEVADHKEGCPNADKQ